MNHPNTKDMEVLAVIPARGGSKSIPRKNLADVCGLPLIAYAIRTALASSLVTRVIVSTEDEEIAETAVAHGAEVPFLRPKHLSLDDTPPAKVLAHLVQKLKEQKRAPDVLVDLFPTHPFRTPALVDELIGATVSHYSLASTVRKIHSSGKHFFCRKGKRLLPVKDIFTDKKGDITYYRNYGLASAEWVGPASSERSERYYKPIVNPISLIDIDDPSDLALTRQIVANNLFDFGVS